MNTTENAALRLPAHFLAVDDLLAFDDGAHRKFKDSPSVFSGAKSFDLFSNGFDPFGAQSALDSPVSSTETNDDGNEDDLLAELTLHLANSTLKETPNTNSNNISEKSWVYSTSPQSTLTGFGPWPNRVGFSTNGGSATKPPSQVPSPPLSPPEAGNNAAWDLLYEAAGEVARLKMNAITAKLNQQRHLQNRELLGSLRSSSYAKSQHINDFYDYSRTNQFEEVKRQGNSLWGCQHPKRSCAENNHLHHSAWPPLRTENPLHHHRQQVGSAMRTMGLGVPGLNSPNGPTKRQSTGTGVFIPRRFGSQPEPRKKPAGCPTVVFPSRVAQALNLNPEELNNGVNYLNSHSRVDSSILSDHEIMMARRNGVMNQERRLRGTGAAATMVGHGVRLPSDWTY